MTTDVIAAARAAVLAAAEVMAGAEIGYDRLVGDEEYAAHSAGVDAALEAFNAKLDAYRDALLDRGRAEGEVRALERALGAAADDPSDDEHICPDVLRPMLDDARKRAKSSLSP